MRLPNSLLHECQVFRNCHTSSLPQPSLAVQRIHHCRTTYLEVSGCVVGIRTEVKPDGSVDGSLRVARFARRAR
jgi:hypothetical protein